MFQNNERRGCWAKAAWQVSNPDPLNPHYILNAKLPETIAMSIPRTLRSRITSFHELPLSLANLTPQHTVVDVHLDQCRNGLIQCIGRCKKLLLAWPATDLNLKTLIEAKSHSNKLLHISDRLEGGILISMDSSNGVVLFSGTIHATITLDSGPLVGINWLSAETYNPALRCIEYEFRTEVEDVAVVLAFYIEQIIPPLGRDENGDIEILQHVVASRQLIFDKCKEPSKETVDQLKRLIQLLRQYCQDPARSSPQQVVCCCGSNPVPDFLQHFRQTHIEALRRFTEGRVKSTARRKRTREDRQSPRDAERADLSEDSLLTSAPPKRIRR